MNKVEQARKIRCSSSHQGHPGPSSDPLAPPQTLVRNNNEDGKPQGIVSVLQLSTWVQCNKGPCQNEGCNVEVLVDSRALAEIGSDQGRHRTQSYLGEGPLAGSRAWQLAAWQRGQRILPQLLSRSTQHPSWH